MHPSVERVVTQLRAAGATGEVKELSESARTAKEAAAALGCEVGAIASSLLFVADDVPVLIMTSGAHRVDEALVQQILRATTFRRANADEVREHTGFAIGGVAPIGHPSPLTTIVDEDLELHPQVWAAAGHSHSVFPTTYDELVRLTSGTPVRVSG